MDKTEHTVEVIYKICLVLLIPLCILFLFLRTELAVKLLMQSGYSCSYRRLTGLWCPGCGGTRAVLYLARFRFLDSFRLNPSVLVAIALYLLFIIVQTLSKMFHFKGFSEKQLSILVYIFIAVVAIRFIAINFII